MENPRAILKLTGPDLKTDRIDLRGEALRIGRAPDNELVLPDQQVSRYHARVFWHEGQYYVEDLGSRNGTRVNGERLTPGEPQALNPGDVIQIGPYTMKFSGIVVEVAEEPPAERPAPMPLPEPEEAPPPPEEAAPPPSVPSKLPEESALGPPPAPPAAPEAEARYPRGIPTDRSSYLRYLPAIYADNDFLGRYLLIFESILSPIEWILDNFDMYLDPATAPREWLLWIAGWFDVLLHPDLPIERQRAIVAEIGELFLRRGTRRGLARLLELYFGVEPEIEDQEKPNHFTVRLKLGRGKAALSRVLAERLIESQKPAHTTYTLEIL